MAKRSLGIVMALFIGIIAVYAFYPRGLPHFPDTETNPARLRVNGVASIGDRLIAVGESGHVLISDDAAATWRDARILPGAGLTRLDSTLTQVAAVGGSVALAVGHD
ncbi:MAG: hypothetical protein WAZ62_18800, partial [Zavarzinia sp.]